MSTTPEELRKLAQELIAKAVEMEKKPAAKWEPKGDFLLNSLGNIEDGLGNDYRREFGSCFQTNEAAESAVASRRLFNRMQCLAAELNPSGKVGGQYTLFWSVRGNEWRGTGSTAAWDYGCLFETEDALSKAKEILNRDGVKPPHLEAQS